MEVVEELGVLGILPMERNEGSMFGCRYGGNSRRGEMEADGPIVRFGGATFRVFSCRGFCSFLCILFLKEGGGGCESIAMGVLLGSLTPSKSGSRGVLSGIKGGFSPCGPGRWTLNELGGTRGSGYVRVNKSEFFMLSQSCSLAAPFSFCDDAMWPRFCTAEDRDTCIRVPGF